MIKIEAEGGAAQRVNLEEQRRREIAEYEKFGEIKKQLHDQPGYDRNLKGTKLPDHELPHPSRQGERGCEKKINAKRSLPLNSIFPHRRNTAAVIQRAGKTKKTGRITSTSERSLGLDEHQQCEQAS